MCSVQEKKKDSELRVPRVARVGDRVADVADPRHQHDQPLEPEPEPGVGHGAVPASALSVQKQQSKAATDSSA